MKTKALISFAVTAKLICVFVFAYAKSRFSHNAAQVMSFKSEPVARKICLWILDIYIKMKFKTGFSATEATLRFENADIDARHEVL